MIDAFFDIFSVHKLAKKIWDLLYKKIGFDDAGRRNYDVDKIVVFYAKDNSFVRNCCLCSVAFVHFLIVETKTSCFSVVLSQRNLKPKHIEVK